MIRQNDYVIAARYLYYYVTRKCLCFCYFRETFCDLYNNNIDRIDIGVEPLPRSEKNRNYDAFFSSDNGLND